MTLTEVVNVGEADRLPVAREIVIPFPNVRPVVSVKAPTVSVNVPFTVVAPVAWLRVTPAVLLMVRLLKIIAMFRLIVWAKLPLKLTVPVEAVKVPVLPVKLPVKLKVLEPPSSVPAVNVTAPLIWCDKLVPRFSVPPLPLMVNPPPMILPVNVAVPAVFVIETKPVVVKSSMLCVVAVPAIAIAELPPAKVPDVVVKFPFRVTVATLPPTVTACAPELFTVKLLKVRAIMLPLIACAAEPLKITVPLLTAKVTEESRVRLPPMVSVPVPSVI